MPAAELRDRVKLQTFRKTTQGTGNQTKEWCDLVEVSARVEMLGGTEDEEHRQQSGEQRFKITVRYSRTTRSLTNEMRLLWCDRVINIGNVRWDERRTLVTIDGMQRKGAA